MIDVKGKLICVDLDGTLCEIGGWTDEQCLNAQPFKDRIAVVNQMVRDGAHIIMYTSRDMNMIKSTSAWLMLNGVSYHGIAMQRKPGADVYIDDKSINSDNFFNSNLSEYERALWC